MMRRFLEIETRTLLLVSFILGSYLVPLYFLSSYGNQAWLLLILLFLLMATSLIFGPVVGLFSSLVFIFMTGSFLFYIALPNTTFQFYEIQIPLHYLLFYGFYLILIVLLCGVVHLRVLRFGKENERLQEEVRQFVAVDPSTGFDNKYRMAIEVSSEIARTKRYGGVFTLLLLQLDFFDDFVRLYGEKEQQHLLASIAEKIRHRTRSTDMKFRYKKNRLGILLTNTGGDFMDVVYEKLAKELKTHQLLSGKYITLSYRTGHLTVTQETEINDFDALLSTVESEMVSSEL